MKKKKNFRKFYNFENMFKENTLNKMIIKSSIKYSEMFSELSPFTILLNQKYFFTQYKNFQFSFSEKRINSNFTLSKLSGTLQIAEKTKTSFACGAAETQARHGTSS